MFRSSTFNFLKRKRHRFAVSLIVADLKDIPYENALLFAKVRLLSGGSFTGETDRAQVQQHRACWNGDFQFEFKVSTQPSTAILEPCLLRISVRKQGKEGKERDVGEKLGYVDVNLCEYAGCNAEGSNRTYILKGYDMNQSHHRPDNSILRINVSLRLLSHDPLFGVPRVPNFQASPAAVADYLIRSSHHIRTRINTALDMVLNPSLALEGRRSESLNNVKTVIVDDLDDRFSVASSGGASTSDYRRRYQHSRQPSIASQTPSRASTSDHPPSTGASLMNPPMYVGRNHSRQSSSESGRSLHQHHRSSESDPMIPTSLSSSRQGSDKARLIDSTRVDPLNVIDELWSKYNLNSPPTGVPPTCASTANSNPMDVIVNTTTIHAEQDNPGL